MPSLTDAPEISPDPLPSPQTTPELTPVTPWRLATRLAFRFCFVYFGLYILLTQMNYVRLQKWFRVYVRFGVATTMLGYGMVKAIPLQMSAPSLMRLLEPCGNFSPMGVLWASSGAPTPPTARRGSRAVATPRGRRSMASG